MGVASFFMHSFISKEALDALSAAERGYIDDVITPSETRLKLIKAFQLLKTKVDTNPKKKHSNIPL